MGAGAAMALTMAACAPTDDVKDLSDVLPEGKALKTMFMYFPYSGTTGNLYDYFLDNVADVETAIINNGGLDSVNVVVFMARSATLGHLYKIKYANGACTHDTLAVYKEDNFNSRAMSSSSWIKYIINQTNSYAPADSFAMLIGCHGLGWLYANPTTTTSAKQSAAFSDETEVSEAKASFPNYSTNTLSNEDETFEYQKGKRRPRTRWFGGTAIKTDIEDLATGITSSSVKKVQFLLFDDCYMAGVECAYALRNACNYFIASPAEVNGNGMPYDQVFLTLAKKTPDYQKFALDYYNYYSEYLSSEMIYPFGQIAVIKSSEMDSLANVMALINKHDSATVVAWGNDTIAKPEWQYDLQYYDGLYPHVFYDFGEYVEYLCSNDSLLNVFKARLDKAVPYKYTTEKGYSDLNSYGYFTIHAYSGISTSEPSNSTGYVWPYYKQTAWYKATH